MKVSVQNIDVTKIKCDLLVINHFEGVVKPGGAAGAVDRALSGLVSKLASSKEITGREGTSTLIHTQGKLNADRVLVVGLGKSKDFDLDAVRLAAATAVRQAKKIKAKKMATIVHGAGIGGLSPHEAARVLAEASVLAEYSYEGYKTGRDDDDLSRLEELVIVDNNASKIKEYQKVVEKALVIAEAANRARDFVNAPGNKMTPTIFAGYAKEMAQEHGIKCTVLGKSEILKIKMGALWGVAKGSKEDPKVVVLEYRKGGKSPLIGLIGKGITFDSGGISLKPSKKMHEMKGDMAGAAAVLCAMAAAADLKIKKNIVAVMPLTENMPDAGALKPGDVVTSLSGKTIEIISTDAEGRMILADAVTYAKKTGAKKLLDIATLTGACIVALGDVATGILGNDQTFVDEVMAAGKRSGEKLWQLPLYKEYRQYLKSDVADIKNASDLGKAGTSSGATFIKEFVGDTPWVHLDIAGTADLDRQIGHLDKGATGAGVFSIVNYLINS